MPANSALPARETRSCRGPALAVFVGLRPARAIAALALLPFLSACTSHSAGPLEPEPGPPLLAVDSSFVDAGLEAGVRAALGRPAGPLTDEVLAGLIRLSARDRDIRDLTGIERLTGLEVLDLVDNRVRDLSPLRALTHLTFLDLENNRVTRIEALGALTHLDFLGLSFNGVTDISPLLSLRRLRAVTLEADPLDPASRSRRLDQLAARGVEVWIGVDGLEDLDLRDSDAVIFDEIVVEDMVRRVIRRPTDQRPLLTRADVESIRTLNLVGQGLTSLRGLENLTGLVSLNVSDNEIADLAPLAALSRLALLTLSGNQISDLKPLAGLTRLNRLGLDGNRIIDVSPLLGMAALRIVTLVGNPLDETSVNVHIEALREQGVKVGF